MSGDGLAASRVGWGFDVHRFNTKPPLVLGGVVVSEELGVSATSDGDVLAHAVADALLGACSLGDLGEHFPSDDPASRGADSMALLGEVRSLASRAGWSPSHVDATVVIEAVRVAPHREAIRAGLAGALGLSLEAVSVKATTTDGVGFVGRGEGIACVAVVTVVGRS
ncbi:MAG TPA: 2-C-methyl-D-erythritol 2,4-cyclodiphosphate synthase [Acidimicrobiia bacterium]|nr:2-C-methyl-D-erythritol 2,4-cyclodiphosphate synthase [Acidimicrobiia bacterium]